MKNVYEGNRYMAHVIRWIDGDTVRLDMDLGQNMCVKANYRLYGIDAPETALRKGVTQEEKDDGLALKEYLNKTYPPGTEIIVQTFGAGKYGRWLVRLWEPSVSGPMDTLRGHTDTAVSLNEWLVQQGLAEEYHP